MSNEKFEELEDVLYGKNRLDATVVSVNLNDAGEPIQYMVELHEGYADPLDKVIWADPNELCSA